MSHVRENLPNKYSELFEAFLFDQKVRKIINLSLVSVVSLLFSSNSLFLSALSVFSLAFICQNPPGASSEKKTNLRVNRIQN